MNRQSRLLATLLFAALPVLPAAAQDVEAGHQIAQRWCSACHEIGTAPVKNDVSPSFWSIARMPSTTAKPSIFLCCAPEAGSAVRH